MPAGGPFEGSPLDRREFLKKLGGAGALLSAAAAFSASLLRRAEAAPLGAPRLIKLHGTPRDIGRQYADQAGDLVLERLRLMRKEGSKVPKESVEQSRIFLNVKANSILVEIEYLAAALRESEEDLLILSAEAPGAGIRRAGCSSFVIDSKISKDAKVWAGQNIDDAGRLERFGVLLLRHPLDAPASLTWALAGGVGAIGMNLKGLALTMNYMQTAQKRAPIAIFPEFVANSALRQKDFKDASAVLTRTQVMTPCTFILAHADGTRVIVERTPHVFHASVPGEHFAAHTNHFLDRGLKEEDTSEKVFPNSKGRLKRLRRLLDRRGLTVEDLKKVLADTEGKPNGICRSAEPRTIASVLMCPEERKMFAAKGRPDEAKYHEFTLTRRPERE